MKNKKLVRRKALSVKCKKRINSINSMNAINSKNFSRLTNYD